MSAKTETEAQSAVTASRETSLLDQAISATKQTDRTEAQELLRSLTEEALKGTVSYSKNLTVTFTKAIAELDKQISGRSPPSCRIRSSCSSRGPGAVCTTW